MSYWEASLQEQKEELVKELKELRAEIMNSRLMLEEKEDDEEYILGQLIAIEYQLAE